MARLRYVSAADIIYVISESSSDYGVPYEIYGSEGSYVSGTTEEIASSTMVIKNGRVWFPEDNESLDLYVDDYYEGTWCWNGSSLSEGECEEEPEYNEAPYVTDVSISLDSYDSSTGYGIITVTTEIYNPNPNRVYGRTSMYLPITQTEDDAKKSSNSWISAYGYQYSYFTYTYYFGGSFPAKIQVRVQGACYMDIGSTSGSMSVSGYYLRSDTVDRTRPDNFYWISSSSSLQSGQEISTYITATKWKSLQSNVNEVRVYRGLSNYSFTTVSKGSTITASLYNEIANSINAMKSGTVSTVSKGQKITASVMMALQNGINSIT